LPVPIPSEWADPIDHPSSPRERELTPAAKRRQLIQEYTALATEYDALLAARAGVLNDQADRTFDPFVAVD
jgi:hypothetical protein